MIKEIMMKLKFMMKRKGIKEIYWVQEAKENYWVEDGDHLGTSAGFFLLVLLRHGVFFPLVLLSHGIFGSR